MKYQHSLIVSKHAIRPLLRAGLAFLLLGSTAACAATSKQSASVQLVADGASEYSIVTGPSPAQQLAASELAGYLETISGARLRVVPESGRAPGKTIRLQIRSSSGAPKPLNHISPSDDAYAIHVRDDGAVVLEGASDRSLFYAVYRFLEQLGCRFLAPQLDFYAGSAEVVPRASRVAAAVGRVESQPVLAYRKLYVEEGHSHDEASLRQIVAWMPKAGYNVLVIPMDYQGQGRVKWDNWRAALTPELQKRGILIEVGGHGYQNFLSAEMPAPGGGGRTMFEAQPEWFAQDAAGRRQRDHRWVFNTANPEAVDFLVDGVVKYVAARPEIQIFDFWPPDGARFDQSPAGLAEGAPVERVVKLTSLVQTALARVRPDVRLEMIAYALYVDPPQSQQLDAGVLLDFCPIDQSFDRQIYEPDAGKNAGYAEALQSWRKAFRGDISLYSYFRKYAWQSLPVIIPRYMQRDIQWYASVPVQGVSTYAEPGDWFTYELNHYVLARLAWDPEVDVEAMVRDFCQARYGAAAPAAERAFLVLEDVVRQFGSVMHTPLKPAGQIRGAQDRMAVAAAAVRTAAQDESDPRIRQHLQRLELVCWHAEADLRVQRMRAEGAGDPELRQAIAGMHRFILENQDRGVFLVHGNRLSLANLMGRHRYGLPPQ